MDIKNKKILIVGLGISGKGACKLALKKGGQVTLFDDNSECKKFMNLEINNDVSLFYERWDFVVVSPGIDMREKRFLPLLDNNKPISEIDFAFKVKERETIAVTGTNGKSTVVSLINFFMNENSVESVACGNYGYPVSDVVSLEGDEHMVVELSSFQLESTYDYFPNIAVCMDITEDHLNRYDSFVDYEQTKIRFIERCHKMGKHIIITEKISEKFSWIQGEKVTVISSNGSCGEINSIVSESGIQGDLSISFIKSHKYLCSAHNLINLLTAAVAVKIKIGNADFSFENYKHLKYRLEPVIINNQLVAVNDAKSSSTDSSIKALEAVSSGKILLLGGRNKNLSFEELCRYLQINKIPVIAYGESKEYLFSLLHDLTDVVKADNLKDAVREAVARREENDVIVFSPGCESFDEFNGYYERGEQFEKNIREFFQTEQTKAC